MVRIGRPEAMHPIAKNISLKVLATKDVRATTESYMSAAFPMDAVEEEVDISIHPSKYFSENV